MVRMRGKFLCVILLALAMLGFQDRLVASDATSDARRPVSLPLLLELLDQKLDEELLVALIEKDCVAFDVTAENVAELSRRLPKRVLQAATDCRRRMDPKDASPSSSQAPPLSGSPSQSPSPVRTPAPNGKQILDFLWKEAAARSVRLVGAKPGTATVMVERGGWPTCSSRLEISIEGMSASGCSVMVRGEVAAGSVPWDGIKSFCRETAKFETFIVHGTKRLGAIKLDDKRQADILEATLRFAGAEPGGSCGD